MGVKEREREKEKIDEKKRGRDRFDTKELDLERGMSCRDEWETKERRMREV